MNREQLRSIKPYEIEDFQVAVKSHLENQIRASYPDVLDYWDVMEICRKAEHLYYVMSVRQKKQCYIQAKEFLGDDIRWQGKNKRHMILKRSESFLSLEKRRYPREERCSGRKQPTPITQGEVTQENLNGVINNDK